MRPVRPPWRRSLCIVMLALAAGRLPSACGKEGYSLITRAEAQRWKEGLKGRVNVPGALARATDRELWDFVPPADLKRAVFLGPNDVGCPVHGKEIFRVGGGFYPWKYSAGKPWKVQCPVGGEYYPTNDFGAYFEAGMKAWQQNDPLAARMHLNRALQTGLPRADAKRARETLAEVARSTQVEGVVDVTEDEQDEAA